MLIPTYVSRSSPQGGAVAPLLDPGTATSGAVGLQRAGAFLSDAAQQMAERDEATKRRDAEAKAEVAKRIAEADDASWVTSTTATAQRQWAERFRTAQDSAGEGAEGFTPTLMDAYDTWVEEQLKTAPSARARMEAQERFTNLGDSLYGRASNFEASARIAKRGADFELSVQDLQTAVFDGADFDQVQHQFNDSLDMAAANGMPPQMVSEWRSRGPALLGQAMARRRMRDDPAGAATDLSGTSRVVWDSATTTMPTASADLVEAVIGQESRGDARALSPKGAAGIMQVMPGTAREIAADLGESDALAGKSDAEVQAFLKDPANGRRYGEHYLNKMLTRYGGDVVVALAAYNAGPGAVDDALKKVDPKSQGYDAFLAALPAETRSYVPGVLGRTGAKVERVTPDWVKSLSPETRFTLAKQAEADALRSQMTTGAQREAFRSEMQDHLASVQATGQGMPGMSATAVAQMLGPEAAGQFSQDQALASRVYLATTQLQAMPPAQAAAAIEALKPAPGSANFDNAQKAYEQVARDYAQQRRAFQEDPAGTVAKLPGVEGRAASFAVQRQLGQPPGTEWLLTKQQAQDTVKMLQGLPAEDAADAMQGLAQSRGGDFPYLFRDLVRTGLPAHFRVLATMDQPQQAAARVALAQAVQAGREPLRKLLSTEAARDTEDQVFSLMQPFLRTLAPAEDGDAIASAYQSAAELLAFKYAQTAQPAEAAQAAVDAITGRWDVVQAPTVVARAPAGLGDQASSYAGHVLGTLQAGELADVGGVLPETLALLPSERQAFALSSLQRNGRWVTAPDGGGWVLIAPNDRIVTRSDGSPVLFRFNDPAFLGWTPPKPEALRPDLMSAPAGPAAAAAQTGIPEEAATENARRRQEQMDRLWRGE